MRFVIVPLGSAGDVNPLVWLGSLLAKRGHEVRVVIQAGMVDYARRAGLEAIPVGSAEQQDLVARDPDIWHPRRGFHVLGRHFAGWARETIPGIRSVLVPGRTVLVGAGIAFGARMVAEADRVPLVTAQLQPCVFMSPCDAPVLAAGMERLRSAPLWFRKLIYRISWFETDRLLRKPINGVRAELGLQNPARGILNGWGLSPDLVLGLFPDWFGPRQPDWPAQTVLTRFPLYDEAGARATPPELEDFLSTGPPPILLTPGSANLHAREFFQEGLAACQSLGRRAMLITPHKEHLPSRLPTGAAQFDFVHFSAVFPRCATVVHHGGVGTSAQGMAAGVPQLAMPMAHDQPDNSSRLRRLGVGDYLYPRQFRAARVAERLKHLLQSAAVAQSCREVRRLMENQVSPGHVAELMESFACRQLGA
jgi:rhamnosyltransferase subunit B